MINNTLLKWYSFDKADLPTALIGGYVIGEQREFLSFDKEILLGYEHESVYSFYNPPSVIVIKDNTAAETFSWLKTYLPECSPLTQFARVINKSDWEKFYIQNKNSSASFLRADRWSSVIVGEILSQSESEPDIKSIPTSRSAACFSSAVAKTTLHYESDEAYLICVERLQKIESDKRFVTRNISISDLLPIWTLVQVQLSENNDPQETALLIADSAIDYAHHLNHKQSSNRGNVLGEFAGLFGDSIEDRVRAFHGLVNALNALPIDSPTDIESNVQIAAAAFLVGRGTTHSFLLSKLVKKWHAVYLWFGLIAAFAGPKTWDADWLRLSKITERSLRNNIDWHDSPACDLCWAEYAWLSRTFNGGDVFSDLPKLVSKVLSIELLPGVTCQLRLVSNSLSENKDKFIEKELGNNLLSAFYFKRDKELQDILSEINKLTAHARELVNNTSNKASSNIQSPLFDNPQPKKPKTRKKAY